MISMQMHENDAYKLYHGTSILWNTTVAFRNFRCNEDVIGSWTELPIYLIAFLFPWNLAMLIFLNFR